MKQYFQAAICIGALVISSATANAATDGAIGGNSTGTTDVSITVPKLIRARSFADYTTGTYPGAGDINQNDDLNISKNYTGTYRVTPSGSGAGGAFTITNGAQTIAYSAFYNDTTGITGRVALTNGVALTAQANSTTTLATTTLNANLSISILAANLLAASAGTYTGTISLVFAPE